MGNLYVVRHALSYYNEQQKYAGNQDIPLSKRGICDSIELGRKFNKLFHGSNIDLVFTSTLSRSFDTAVLLLSEINLSKTPIKISRKKFATFNNSDMIPIVSFSELNERDYGILQNMNKEDVQNQIAPDLLQNWRRDFYAGPKSGETFQRVVSRVARFYFGVLLPKLKDNDILLVAHQNTIRALYYLIYNVDKLDIKNIEFDNNEIWTINYNQILNKNEVIRKNVIIMAAGKGTRMKGLTINTPKPLLEVEGHELVFYPVNAFSKQSYNITVAYSYLREKWEPFKNVHKEVNFCYTGESMSYWEDFLIAYSHTKQKSNYFVVISGDMLFDYTIVDKAIQQHIIDKNSVTVALNKTDGKQKKWRYVFASNNTTIKDIVMEKTFQPYERYFVIFNKEIIDDFLSITEAPNFSKENEFGNGITFILKHLLDIGVKIKCLTFNCYLLNINDPEDLESAGQYIRGEKK